MRIDWTQLQLIYQTLGDDIKNHVSILVHEYLIGTQTQTIKDELMSLRILVDDPTPINISERRTIVQPFNFVSNNDGAQSN
jgi:hypothetical protein